MGWNSGRANDDIMIMLCYIRDEIEIFQRG